MSFVFDEPECTRQLCSRNNSDFVTFKDAMQWVHEVHPDISGSADTTGEFLRANECRKGLKKTWGQNVNKQHSCREGSLEKNHKPFRINDVYSHAFVRGVFDVPVQFPRWGAAVLYTTKEDGTKLGVIGSFVNSSNFIKIWDLTSGFYSMVPLADIFPVELTVVDAQFSPSVVALLREKAFKNEVYYRSGITDGKLNIHEDVTGSIDLIFGVEHGSSEAAFALYEKIDTFKKGEWVFFVEGYAGPDGEVPDLKNIVPNHSIPVIESTAAIIIASYIGIRVYNAFPDPIMDFVDTPLYDRAIVAMILAKGSKDVAMRVLPLRPEETPHEAEAMVEAVLVTWSLVPDQINKDKQRFKVLLDRSIYKSDAALQQKMRSLPKYLSIFLLCGDYHAEGMKTRLTAAVLTYA